MLKVICYKVLIWGKRVFSGCYFFPKMYLQNALLHFRGNCVATISPLFCFPIYKYPNNHSTPTIYTRRGNPRGCPFTFIMWVIHIILLVCVILGVCINRAFVLCWWFVSMWTFVSIWTFVLFWWSGSIWVSKSFWAGVNPAPTDISFNNIIPWIWLGII